MAARATRTAPRRGACSISRCRACPAGNGRARRAGPCAPRRAGPRAAARGRGRRATSPGRRRGPFAVVLHAARPTPRWRWPSRRPPRTTARRARAPGAGRPRDADSRAPGRRPRALPRSPSSSRRGRGRPSRRRRRSRRRRASRRAPRSSRGGRRPSGTRRARAGPSPRRRAALSAAYASAMVAFMRPAQTSRRRAPRGTRSRRRATPAPGPPRSSARASRTHASTASGVARPAPCGPPRSATAAFVPRPVAERAPRPRAAPAAAEGAVVGHDHDRGQHASATRTATRRGRERDADMGTSTRRRSIDRRADRGANGARPGGRPRGGIQGPPMPPGTGVGPPFDTGPRGGSIARPMQPPVHHRSRPHRPQPPRGDGWCCGSCASTTSRSGWTRASRGGTRPTGAGRTPSSPSRTTRRCGGSSPACSLAVGPGRRGAAPPARRRSAACSPLAPHVLPRAAPDRPGARTPRRGGFAGMDARRALWVVGLAAVNPFWIEYAQEARMYAALLAESLGPLAPLPAVARPRRARHPGRVRRPRVRSRSTPILRAVADRGPPVHALLARAAHAAATRSPCRVGGFLVAVTAAGLSFVPWFLYMLQRVPRHLDRASTTRSAAWPTRSGAWASGPRSSPSTRRACEAGPAAVFARGAGPRRRDGARVGRARSCSACAPSATRPRRVRVRARVGRSCPSRSCCSRACPVPAVHEKYLIFVAPFLLLPRGRSARAPRRGCCAPCSLGRPRGAPRRRASSRTTSATRRPRRRSWADHVYGKEQWREAHAFGSRERGPKGDVVLLHAPFTQHTWDFYERAPQGGPRRCSPPAARPARATARSRPTRSRRALPGLADAPGAFLVLSHPATDDRDHYRDVFLEAVAEAWGGFRVDETHELPAAVGDPGVPRSCGRERARAGGRAASARPPSPRVDSRPMARSRAEVARRIAILTGGGDCPGLNAVIRAVVKTAENDFGWEVYGVRDGFEGFLASRGDRASPPRPRADIAGILPPGGTILGASNRATSSPSSAARRCSDECRACRGASPRLGLSGAHPRRRRGHPHGGAPASPSMRRARRRRPEDDRQRPRRHRRHVRLRHRRGRRDARRSTASTRRPRATTA